MSLSSAMNSAMSGLTAAGRASLVVSDNIANVMTRGYARRSLTLASNSQSGPGVRVLGVERQANPGIIANRRQADAEHGFAAAVAGFHADLASLVGQVDDPASVSMRLAAFENSLLSAASRPESPQRLDTAASEAASLARAIGRASEGLRSMRTRSDHAIGDQVNRLNKALSDVQKLNVRITSTGVGGGSTASLLDQRQILIDEINTIVPVSVVARNHGQVALFTGGGAVLLDGPAAQLKFASVTETMPEMTLANGALSGLEINGIPVRTDSTYSAVRGGTLAAQFQIRDELAVTAQIELDAVARDLVERFETPALDATLTPGDPGLFTDDGNAFDPLLEIGLAGRLEINVLVDPSRGGESWRLRTGLGAALPGEPGEARQLQAFRQILSEPRTPALPVFGTGVITAKGMVTGLISQVSRNSNLAGQSLSFAAASQTELTRIELEQGVDTDAELQALMIVERAYAANARMIEAADDMMQALLRI